MPSVRITGGARIADPDGTHEPDALVRLPSPELVALAEAGTKNPETGKPYAAVVKDEKAIQPEAKP